MAPRRIFNDLGDQLVAHLLNLLIAVHRNLAAEVRKWWVEDTINSENFLFLLRSVVELLLVLPVLAASNIIVFLYGYAGPYVCIGLATWRLWRRNYGSSDGNLAPAMNMFYSLIICQGALYLLWLFYDLGVAGVLVEECQYRRMPTKKWGYEPLVNYLNVCRAKCWRDPASIKGWTISRYAVDLIDFASWDDNVWGMRMLAEFINQGSDVRSLLLPSRPRIQKLIDTLGWRAGPSREIRENAACIVAHLAGDIHLAQFPGAIQCISSLLQDETTRTHLWNSSQQQGIIHSRHRSRPRSISEASMFRKLDKGNRNEDSEAGGGCNELILQGLSILEKLALDHENCVDICTSPGLLTRIMTHLYSPTLIQDIKANGPWVHLVNGTFSVLHNLICAPDEACRRLRQDISTNQRSVTNLESILNLGDGAEHRELQISAMEILTELASDSSINLTVEVKESLIRKQLQIFLADEGGERSAARRKKLKVRAGRTLVFLSANSELNSAIVKDSLGSLTQILDADNKIKYRTIAAKILGNLCARFDVDKERVKEILLPKALGGLLPNNSGDLENQTIRVSEGNDAEDCNISTQGGDEENQTILAAGNDAEERNSSTPGDIISTQEIPEEDQSMSSDDEEEEEEVDRKELQEALLSLILVIYEKVICADDFNEVEREGPRHGAFVTVLKAIVQENCEATIISLRIVKLCGQIVRSMMRHNQYIEQFINQEFLSLFYEAKEIMSNLESCLLFAGTDRELKKATRPLLSELEEELKAVELVV